MWQSLCQKKLIRVNFQKIAFLQMYQDKLSVRTQNFQKLSWLAHNKDECLVHVAVLSR